MSYRRSLCLSTSLAVFVVGGSFSPVAHAQDSTAQSTSAGTAASMSDSSAGAIDAGSVAAAGGYTAESVPTSSVLTPEQKMRSSQSVTTIDQSQLQMVSPQASGMQALTLAPGVTVSGYSNQTGAARSTLDVRGVKVGWNSVPGDLQTNGLTAEFDGIPLNSLIQGTGWHSTEVPMALLMSGTNLIFGPGNPRERYYDSLGGTVNFIPVQPTDKASAQFSAGYGSYNSQIFSATGTSGEHDGWSSVIGFVHSSYDSFRGGASTWPSTGDQVFFKTNKRYSSGNISFGFYWQHSDEYRPNMIPVDPIPGVTVAGLGQNAPLYSQKTTGFYSALPTNVWYKENQIENVLAYAKLDQELSDNSTLYDDLWFRHGLVTHHRINNQFPPLNPTGTEFYDPHSDTLGDKLYVDTTLYSGNVLTAGGYAIISRTADRLSLYNELMGKTPAQPSLFSFGTYDNAALAAFVQDDITLFKRLRIVPGVEFVNYQTSFTNNDAGPASVAPNASYSAYPNVAKSFNTIQPSIGTNLEILPWLSVYTNAAITYQNPTAGNFTNLQTDLPALKPIQSVDEEFGFRFNHDGLFGYGQSYGSINYFHTHLANETIPLTLASNPAVTTFGYGAATNQGVSVEANTDINFAWNVFANAQYLNSVWDNFFSTTTNQNYNGFPVSNSPVTTANLGVRYRKAFGETMVTTSVVNQYVGQSYLYSNLTGSPTKQTISPYNLLNVFIDADVPVTIDHTQEMVKVSFAATNILARRYNSTAYISSGGYFGAGAGTVLANPGAPQAFYGTVTIGF